MSGTKVEEELGGSDYLEEWFAGRRAEAVGIRRESEGVVRGIVAVEHGECEVEQAEDSGGHWAPPEARLIAA